LKAVVDGRHVDPALQGRSAGYVSALSEALGKIAWTDLEAATGTARDTFLGMASALAQGRRVVVLAGQDLLRSAGSYDACLTILDLLLLTGKLAEPGCGLAPLAEENNDQGAVEMGALAELLPGPRDVAAAEERSAIARAWKAELPSAGGATLKEMIDGARAGRLKAMVVVGENPVGSLPAHMDVAEALRSLELLICQELFLTETAALAHVVLPAAAPLEKHGTWTNEEGHVQAVRPAIEPRGESRPDWEILSALSILLGTSLEYGESKDVLKEIRSVIPEYGTLGPAPMPPKIDSTAVERYLAGDYRQDLATRYTLAPRRPQADGTAWHMRLTQSLFHSGKLSTHAKGLLELEEQGVLRMNRGDAGRLGIADGDRVRLSNHRGELVTTVKLVERVPAGAVWFPDHFAQEASMLFDCTIDPVTKAPAFRTTSVSIVKAV
jgi:formate dehydrogenase alpha subunit